jgi:hypothetical protein
METTRTQGDFHSFMASLIATKLKSRITRLKNESNLQQPHSLPKGESGFTLAA